MSALPRRCLGAALIALTVIVGVVYVANRGRGAGEVTLDLTRAGSVLYVDASGRVAQTPTGGGPSCLRSYYAAGTLVCLRLGIAADATKVVVFDRDLKQRLELSQWGVPSRARVSPSGYLVAFTVFRSGDSYLAPNGGFSTTAGIYDLRTGAYYGSLEDFELAAAAVDRNFWGITFTRDDQTFYATLGSGGKTWLVRGDLRTRRLERLRENVECPSLSPDETRLVYKKRFGDRWRLHVLTLASLEDRPLSEVDSVDDQVAWLDDATLAYAKPHGRSPAIFTLPADGTGAPKLLAEGSSPSPVR